MFLSVCLVVSLITVLLSYCDVLRPAHLSHWTVHRIAGHFVVHLDFSGWGGVVEAFDGN